MMSNHARSWSRPILRSVLRASSRTFATCSIRHQQSVALRKHPHFLSPINTYALARWSIGPSAVAAGLGVVAWSSLIRKRAYHLCQKPQQRPVSRYGELKKLSTNARKIKRTKQSFLWRLLSGVKNLFRSLELLLIFSPCILLLPVYALFPESKVLGYQDWWLVLFVRCVERAGPTYIKLGQWASTRADLFSARLRSHLRSLHDNCVLEPWYKTKQTLETAFGKELNEVFVEIEQTPIGAGCIAQVHRAQLHKGEEPVAVKVQRVGALKSIVRDVSLFQGFVYMLNALPQTLTDLFGLTKSTELFSEFMLSQLDFHQEARNLERFRENFEGYTVAGYTVQFPKPIEVSPCGNVLIESLESGIPLITLLDENNLDPEMRVHIGHVGVQTFLKMVLLDNFCHSDLHPGNILVQFDNKGGLLGLTLVDVGLATTLGEKDQRNFLDLFSAVAFGKGRRAGELMIERADQTKIDPCMNREQFVEGVAEIVSTVKLSSFRLDRIQIGSVLERVLGLVRDHRVPVDATFTNIILSIIILEGLGRQLNPTLDIFKESLPILGRLSLTVAHRVTTGHG